MGGEDPIVHDKFLGAPARVELHRQRHQLENDSRREENDPELGQSRRGQEDPREDHDPAERRAYLCCGDERRPHLQGSVGVGMLDRVAGLVAGNADSGDRRPVMHVRREGEAARRGVVVVGEQAVGAADPDVVEPGLIQHGPRRLGSRHPRPDLAPLPERGLGPGTRPQGEQHPRNHEEQVDRIKEEHGLAVLAGPIGPGRISV